MAVSVQQVQRRQCINLGEGYVQVGSSEKDLQDVGSLEGNTVITSNREQLPIVDGNPGIIIGQRIVSEMVNLAFVMKEQFPEDILKHLGYDNTSLTNTPTTSTIARKDEQKVLWGTEWANLKGKPVLASPVPSVDDGAATPTSYTENDDYIIDYKEGKIRRVATGAISDGGRIYIDYSYTEQKNRSYDFGGDMAEPMYFYWRFVFTRADGYRETYDFYLATFANPTAENFNKGAFNTREIVLQVIADNTKPSGQKYYNKKSEYTSGA